MFALVDANNFYVSVERVFRASLNGLPVIVLSNNDGCAIARSNEAKALGITMGMPWFQIQKQFPDAGVVALSANFGLYGDISNRVMSLVGGLGPAVEQYSIDEAFADLTGVPCVVERAKALRARILQWVGIPCCVGIGRTKTLAKLANHVAKTAERKPGSYPADLAQVANLDAMPRSDFEAILAATDLGEIWGIGPRIAAQLQADGLQTALDVLRMDPMVARRRWSVVVERTVRELQGTACIALEDMPPAKKEIASTRSFGQTVTALPDLVEAVTDFAGRAAEKLRKQDSFAAEVLVFVHTSPFRKNDKQYSRSVVVPLRRPTADTALITQAAVLGLRAIYRPGYNFAKAGVLLLGLQDAGVVQHELDLDDAGKDRSQLMSAMDRLNARYGRGTVMAASSGTGGARRRWVMKQSLKTPNYTTDINDIPIARA